MLVDFSEFLEGIVTTIEYVVRACLIGYHLHCLGIVDRSSSDVVESWHLCLYVVKDMSLNTTFLLAELRPPEHRQTERYGGGIKGIHLATELENVCHTLLSCLLHHEEGELLKDAVVTILICRGKRCLGYGLAAQAKMKAFPPMCFKPDYQVSQALAITELAEHQCK